METVFHVRASMLDSKFLNAIKNLFGRKEVEISISDVPDADETQFLLGDPKNKAHLLKAISQVKRNKNLVRFTAEEFDKYARSLTKK